MATVVQMLPSEFDCIPADKAKQAYGLILFGLLSVAVHVVWLIGLNSYADLSTPVPSTDTDASPIAVTL